MPASETCKMFALALAIAVAALFRADTAHAAPSEVLTVAGGCFWCVESDFEQVDGVIAVVSGYTGGHVDNPTYKQVTRGGTGHYEAVEITFDPDVVSRETLLDLFLRSIDVTDAGGQFCDRGDSYRSAIFVSDAGEKALAARVKAQAEETLGKPVVTPILDLGPFYAAEEYHQDFYKSTAIILTRGGPKSKAKAYKFYREGCGRDARVAQVWGDNAAFAAGH
ncbi:MAG: peptide-methionine (S)-S-oxide reductase MsrA [Marinibacterium sp.]